MAARLFPSLNWLRVFEAAARTESFARAAEELAISPAAVSQQVRALETHLRQPLFLRGARHVTLTDAGGAFLPVVQHALGSVEMAGAALFGAAGRQTVTLQAVLLLTMGWLGPRLAAFEAAHPTVRVNLATGNFLDEFHAGPPGGQADLRIAFGSASDFPDDAVRLIGETLSIVASREVAVQMRRPADLAGARLYEVSSHRSGWQQVLAGLPELDRHALDLVFVDNSPSALTLASQTGGLALARSPATDTLVAALGLVPIGFPAPIAGTQAYHLLRPVSRPMSPAAARLHGWLTAASQAGGT